MKSLFHGIAALAVGLSCWSCRAPVDPADLAASAEFNSIYTDHMVLQRDRPVAIAGKADPGGMVAVEFNGRTNLVRADEEGRWKTTFPAVPAGGPYTLTLTSQNGSRTLSDILAGEVWLASGQSNMEMPVDGHWPFWSARNGAAEAAAADYPEIRLYNATDRKYVSPFEVQADAAGPGWQVCTPEAAAPFSAVAYFFGRQLHRDLQVPVGLISASWGGTPIQPWISLDGYRCAGRPEADEIRRLGASKEESRAHFRELQAEVTRNFEAWEARFFASDPAATQAAQQWKEPDWDDSDWEAIPRLYASFPAALDGVGWYRVAVDIPEEWAGRALTLSLGPVDDCDQTYFNGVLVGATDTKTENFWFAPRVYPVPPEAVRAGRAVVAVRVIDMFASGGLQGGRDEMFLTPDGEEKVYLDGPWRFRLEFAADPGKIGTRPEVTVTSFEDNPGFPATLYNSMIAPWTGFPIRGAIWYQGESNAGAAEDYLTLHKLLISDWRSQWNDPEMPFLFVQLSGFEQHTPDKRLPDDYWQELQPSDPDWAKLREVQLGTLAVPNTGMAVSIDVGDHSDIHPPDKQSVGFRLAREAERIAYGMDIVSAGPYFQSMTLEDGQAVLSFTNVGSGLIAGDNPEGRLNGFAVAGSDGRFVWADAVIDGDRVVVRSPEVAEPVAVRYAWLMYHGNLNFYNKEGFPASPFRTDLPDYLR